MNVEVLIYAYLAVCAAMIVFNIVCTFVFRMEDKRLGHYSQYFMAIVHQSVALGMVTDSHRTYLAKKLKKIRNLMAFEKTLDELYAQNPKLVENYLRKILPVFAYLTMEYQHKSEIQTAYFPYIISKYKVFYGRPIRIAMDMLLELVRSPSLYVRENALQAIYSSGSTEDTMKALWILNESNYYHNPKMITDGLLNFTGDTKELSEQLWKHFELFTFPMRRIIVDYFRFSSSDHQERILELLTAKPIDDELAYSCIRYFGRYPYDPAYPIILEYAENYRSEQWVYAAIAATALASYPGERTTAVLKKLLKNETWYVRYNASQSLMTQGLYYTDMIDIFEGGDRYAGEILRYRFDQKKMKEKEAADIGLGC